MTKNKHLPMIAICALLLIFLCLFTACGDPPTDESTEIPTLEDFTYDTDIDTDHVITEAELTAMNNLWLYEFGKKFAETPEEAMYRETDGNFYFGRYGRTFVFYQKQYNMDMSFGWGKRDFVIHWGIFYFVNGNTVYTLDEIMKTDVFTQEHIDALQDRCMNYYPTYVPVITLPEGDYVLTAEELAEMQEAFDGAVSYSVFATLNTVMSRKQNSRYYFGKFGDTVIIWVAGGYEDLLHGFEWCGYNFDFYAGRLYFYENGKLYDHNTAKESFIMTSEEIEAFYNHYITRFVPFNARPYTYLEFTEDVEKLTEDEMRSIDDAYAAWKYEQEYQYYYEMYIDTNYSEQKARDTADRAAHRRIGYDPRRFFNEENFKIYRYYGKRNGKIFLSEKYDYDYPGIFEIAGYKFLIDNGANEVLVYADGEFTELTEAYEKGIVSKDDVAFVHGRTMAYAEYFREGLSEIAPPARLKIGKPYKESPITLSEELQREIVWEYIADSTMLEEDLLSSYAVRCYGRSGDTYAVMIDGPYMYTQAIRSETVAGYTFTFSDGQRMYVYKCGEFYSRYKAYTLGIITEDFIASIEWSKTAPYTVKKTSEPIELTEKDINAIIRAYTEYGAPHKKGAEYSVRCYGATSNGYVVFIDCSDKEYEKNTTSETVGGYEFIYPTEQKLLFTYAGDSEYSLEDALKYKMIDEAELKAVYETYRASYPELYK